MNEKKPTQLEQEKKFRWAARQGGNRHNRLPSGLKLMRTDKRNQNFYRLRKKYTSVNLWSFLKTPSCNSHSKLGSCSINYAVQLARDMLLELLHVLERIEAV